LTGVELGHHRFEYFIDDGGQNTLIVVLAQGAVYLREVRNVRSRKHSATDVDLPDCQSTDSWSTR
jgi:hypothetical protein